MDGSRAVASADHKHATPNLAFIQDMYNELRDEESVRDLLINVLLAGRDTTACLMTWAMHLIIRHLHVHRRLQKELDAVVGNEKHFTQTHIKKMTFLQHVLTETLRL